jgi:hypothetical protein
MKMYIGLEAVLLIKKPQRPPCASSKGLRARMPGTFSSRIPIHTPLQAHALEGVRFLGGDLISKNLAYHMPMVANANSG